MHSLTLLWLPIIALLVLAAIGAAPARALATRIPADAQAALAVVSGAAIVACASPLLVLDVPLKIALAAVGLVSALIAVVVRPHIGALVRAASVPLIVAVASLAFVSAPWIKMASWEPASFENADSYIWVSQAKSYLDGPPPLPASSYPNRVAVDLVSSEQHLPVALPFGVAAIASLSGTDPGASYSAFAVLLAVLLTLTVYVVGRAAFEWSRRKTAVAALVVTSNAYVLFATYYGWQAQIGLTMFSLASVTCFRLAVERPAIRREQLLAGLFGAAAVAAYGSLVTAFIPLFAFVLAGFAARYRGAVSFRALVRVVFSTAAWALLLGLIPVVRAVMSVGALSHTLPEWDRYGHGIVPDAVGLVPSSDIFSRGSFAWTVLAALVCLAILAMLARLPREAGLAALGSRHDFLLAAAAYFGAVLSVLLIPGFSPYWSIKIAGYGAPFLVLAAFAILTAPGAGQRATRRLAVYTAISAACLFSLASARRFDQGLTILDRSRVYAGLAARLSRVPDVRVQIDVPDPWRQSWAVYYLRDTPVVVPHPTIFLAGWGPVDKVVPTRPSTYRLAVDDGPGAIWYGGGLALRAIRAGSSSSGTGGT